ncbi:MAG: hypothetical protein OZ913_10150 [Ignavibacteriaceae bacterium]|jgi:uncharacterized membrane protein|nr:MAG: hypothetical protein EDM69_09940 [Chlorobiota bacterium]KXK04121.1 MAG: hypothetical protein UZ04_CHB001001159 [Chlorobi bacterium OLB4]MBV6397894.1 hypothetical protein [Ignavibacteria bacterium]MCC6886841.1 hypothetical protein [Ignavibacteriales bacterium]MCE7953965.1 hypothetical protein [Chlorobi bacterium CHB7]MEB2330643.1 hypothetical protein [Ignavibacteriaceae bacterium]OQY76739.1 MAG: hypothetical protein B6D43_08915 [Ignavibacteriales bacterium UTCHB1]RIK47699.1 MAG: hypot
MSERNLQFTPEEIESGKTMGILAWIIFLIPLFAARDQRYAMFQTEQAIILAIVGFVVYLGIWILTFIVGQISSGIACLISVLSFLPWVLYLVLWIIGLLGAIQGKTKPLPVIGQYGEKLNLVK